MLFKLFFKNSKSIVPSVADLTSRLNDDHGDRTYEAFDAARRTFRQKFRSLDEALLGLKIINLAIARYEYGRRSVATIARPLGFMLDTANQCQLGCPSCMNSVNTEFSERTFKQWPRGMMAPDTFHKFIDAVGLTAFSGHFYNNHEPFLNRHTPAFIRVASDLRVETLVSSNLSYAKIDAAAIVKSGLNELMVAIDGTTQDAYEKYRKRGRLDWVLANAKAIADARRELNSPTPYLRWQFLTFKHNVHQVEDAIKLARELGFDAFNLATPFPVHSDDPNVHSMTYEGPEEHKSVVFNQRRPAPFTADLEPHADQIIGRLDESILDRRTSVAGDDHGVDNSAPEDRCDWLHMAVITDAMGRVVPCCLGDYVNQGQFVFSNIAEHTHNLMNSPEYRDARLFLANPKAWRDKNKGIERTKQVRCITCPERPRPQIGLGAVAGYFINGNNAAAGQLAAQHTSALYSWSKHSDYAGNRSSRPS